MSITLDQASELVQHRTRVLDCEHHPVGVLTQVYVDDDSSEPLWAAVVFDRPAGVETVVPLYDADLDGDDLVTAYPRTVIETGPHITASDELPWAEEDRLRVHYGQHTPASAAPAIVPITDLASP